MRPTQIEDAAPPERRQAIWPWLLVPLVALAMFFVLSRLRESHLQPPSDSVTSAAATEQSASSD